MHSNLVVVHTVLVLRHLWMPSVHVLLPCFLLISFFFFFATLSGHLQTFMPAMSFLSPHFCLFFLPSGGPFFFLYSSSGGELAED